ncbi:MAG TPA: hypothetical protein VGD64_09515 [Acidisarcina sp.]
MHDVIGFGLVIAAILAGILLNRYDVKELRGDTNRGLDKLESRLDKVQGDLSTRLDRVHGELSGRLDRMQADLSQFYRTAGQHETRLDTLEKRVG